MKMRIAFYVSLGIALIVWMEGPVLLFGIASPFVDLSAFESGPTYHAQIHRWHEAMFPTASMLLFSGCLIGLVRRTIQRPVLLQFAVAGHVLALIAVATSGQIAAFVVFAIWMLTCALLIAFYPQRRLLLLYRSPQGWSGPLVGLTLVVAALLSVDIWMNLSRILSGFGGEHLSLGHWLQAAYVDLLLILAGVMAASRLGGHRALGGITGGAFVFLGLAALALPGQAGSWGLAGGLLAISAGTMYLVLSAVSDPSPTKAKPNSVAVRVPPAADPPISA